MAAVFLAPVYILLNLYILRWVCLWLDSICPFFQIPLFPVLLVILYIILSTSPLTGFLIKKPLIIHRVLKITGNFFLGIFLYILIIVFTADLCRIIIKYCFHLSSKNTEFTLMLTGTVCTLIIALLCIYGMIHVSEIHIKDYDLDIRKPVSGISSLKIVLVADFHFGFSTDLDHTQKIVQRINDQNADLVCIAGDIFDNEYDAISHPTELQNMLCSIKSRYGVYACWGNHDLNEPILAGFTFRRNSKNPADPRMKTFADKSGIHILSDQIRLIDNKFYLIGREDPGRAEKLGIKRKTPVQLTEKLDREKPVIILDHQPKELNELAEAGADLDLCGHTHDGQIFPGNLFTRVFWENSCGYLRKGSMHSIVTSGAGVWGPAMRIGTNSEICVIHLTFPVTRTLKPEKDFLQNISRTEE